MWKVEEDSLSTPEEKSQPQKILKNKNKKRFFFRFFIFFTKFTHCITRYTLTKYIKYKKKDIMAFNLTSLFGDKDLLGQNDTSVSVASLASNDVIFL